MKNYMYTLIIGLIFGCKTPYQPVLNNKITNYLVVEGVINSSSTDTTFIKLSRTVNLTSAAASIPELRAQVWVEDGQGFTVALQEKPIGPKGIYVAAALGLDITKKYRLRIKTIENKTYLSELNSVIPTPPIDNIGFYNKNTGIQIYVNTHDPKNNTRYYMWDFTETWSFVSPLDAKYVSNRVAIVERPPELFYPKVCWGTDIAHNIVINSSVKLTQDVIYQAPITYIDGSSEKISLRYSILLRQYAISKEAYGFWEQLKKNTESLGTIFDAQPSESKSNIHCVENAAEQVLGYIMVTNVQSKRVYFNRGEMNIFTQSDMIKKCVPDSIYFFPPVEGGASVATVLIPGLDVQPLSPFYLINGAGQSYIAGYLGAGRICVDCTTRGTKTPPSFWKDQ